MKLLLLPLFILTTSCSLFGQKEWSSEDWDTIPVRQTSFWKNKIPLNLPIEKKVTTPPKEMLKYVRDMNEIDGILATPKPVTLNQSQRKIVHLALQQIPERIKKAINRRLIGIFFFDNLGGSALTEAMVKDHLGILIFDIKVLEKKANDWCSWKESSPFKQGDLKIRCSLANEKNNNSITAFTYIFLHEAAHLLNIGRPDLPFWFDSLDKQEVIDKSPFLKQSWEVKKEETFPTIQNKPSEHLLHQVKYYQPKKLPNKEMLKAYQELKTTSLPTLYSTINPWDDFAETFVNYIHTQILGRRFQIEVLEKGKVKLLYSACWKEKRCGSKSKVLKQILRTL